MGRTFGEDNKKKKKIHTLKKKKKVKSTVLRIKPGIVVPICNPRSKMQGKRITSSKPAQVT